MRVSDLLMNNSYLNNISSNKSKMETLSQKIANQSKILKPSDSPIGTSKILRLNNKMSAADLYMKNIQNSFGFVDSTIRSMETMEGEISGLLTTLTEANNAINSENLSSYADKLDNVLDNLLTAANSSYDGKYLFGGTSFSSNPYSLTSDRSAVVNNGGDLSGHLNVNIGHGVNQKINITGAELFGTIPEQNIFNTIIKVRDQLKSGSQPEASDVNKIKDFHNRLLNKMSDAGSIYNTLENTKSLLESQRVEIEGMLSSEKDLDMAKAIIEMQNYDYLLQVSYKMSAMILPKSLLDFI